MNPIVESVATSEDVGQQNPKKELHPTWKSILIVALVFSVLWLFVSFGLFILIISIAKGALLILFLIPIIIASIHILNICLIAKNLKSNEVIYLSGLPIL